MNNEQLFKVGDIVVLKWYTGGDSIVAITETPGTLFKPYYVYTTLSGKHRGNQYFHCNCKMLCDGDIKKLPEIKAILYRSKV